MLPLVWAQSWEALSQHTGWWWIFWLLALLSGLCLLLIVFFLPETSRLIVGNGSIAMAWYHQTALSLLRRTYSDAQSKRDAESLPKRKFHILNPTTCLKLLFHRSTALIVLVNGIFYMTYGCIQASMSSLFIQLYAFNQLEAGLIYLPFGAGCALASLLSGIVPFSIHTHLLLLRIFCLTISRPYYELGLPSHS
jgi:predicted MFS family arabinose efflux permease